MQAQFYYKFSSLLLVRCDGLRATCSIQSTSYETHIGFRISWACLVIEAPEITTASTTKEELLHFHREMYTIRRMEITCDTEYKVRILMSFWFVPIVHRHGTFVDSAICMMAKRQLLPEFRQGWTRRMTWSAPTVATASIMFAATL